MKRFFLMIVIVLNAYIIEEKSIIAYAKEDLRLYSTAAVLMDADSGRVLFGKNEDLELAMASTTKIMTLIVTLENADLSEKVTVSSYAASMPDVQLNIKEGEEYILNDLLYSLMLESHNDTAVAIAEHVGGSVEGFACKMNEKASEIGCEKTEFVTPNGLDKANHHTTAKDLAKIMAYCVEQSPKKEEFKKITRTQSYSFSDVAGKRHFTCNNHNAFLNMMDGVISGKTGYTSKAGYCYVCALKSEGRTFVVSLLGCGWPNHKTYKWTDTKTLMQYGIENYHYKAFDDVMIPDEIYKKIYVKNAKTLFGKNSYVGVELMEEKSESYKGVLIREGEEIVLEYEKCNMVNAPIKKGEKLGNLCYLIKEKDDKNCENTLKRTCNILSIIAAESIEKNNYQWCLKIVFCLYLQHLGAFYVNK